MKPQTFFKANMRCLITGILFYQIYFIYTKNESFALISMYASYLSTYIDVFTYSSTEIPTSGPLSTKILLLTMISRYKEVNTLLIFTLLQSRRPKKELFQISLKLMQTGEN